MNIKGIHHVQISIPKNCERQAREFYCGILQLEEIPKPESLAGRGGFWLRVGDREVHIGTEEGVNRSLTKAHIAYEVTNLEEIKQRLLKAGLQPLSSVPIPGYDRFEIRDPFGNRVEFIQKVDFEKFPILPRHRVTCGAAVINDEQDILLIRGPHRGWELPGGHVEEGESIEEALIREVEEETGIHIKILSFRGVSQELQSGIINLFWLAKPIGGEIRPSEESLEVKFVSIKQALNDISNENFRKELIQTVSANEKPFHFIFN